jgi:GNAT superfamily N-acetyltransferase
MASLWAKYLSERDKKEVLEAEHGFAVFSFLEGNICYLEELFVDRDFRLKGLSVQLAQEVEKIALERGATLLVGSVRIVNDAKASRESARVVKGLINYGMEPYDFEASTKLLFFRKHLVTSSEVKS